jgi:teichuronic acid biosynthesis glycosyltransferase TuaG
MNLLVSIIMPVFNGEKYITESIESVIDQSYINWELLIIDDGSTDDTSSIVNLFTNDERIKYFYKNNEGPAKARNYGIKKSDGIYIAFLDADDLWHKEKLKLQLEYILKFNYSFVFCNFVIINDKSKIIGKNFINTEDNSNENLLVKDYIGTLSVIFNREIINKIGYFDEKIINTEDWDYWIRISKFYKLGFLNLTLASYRQHNDGISKNAKVQLANEFIVLNKHIKNSTILSTSLKNSIFWNHYKSSFLHALKMRDIKYITIYLIDMSYQNLFKTIKFITQLLFIKLKQKN